MSPYKVKYSSILQLHHYCVGLPSDQCVLNLILGILYIFWCVFSFRAHLTQGLARVLLCTDSLQHASFTSAARPTSLLHLRAALFVEIIEWSWGWKEWRKYATRTEQTSNHGRVRQLNSNFHVGFCMACRWWALPSRSTFKQGPAFSCIQIFTGKAVSEDSFPVLTSGQVRHFKMSGLLWNSVSHFFYIYI